MEQGKFMFKFFHIMDLDKTYNGGPWNFNGHMLVLNKVPTGDITLNPIVSYSPVSSSP